MTAYYNEHDKFAAAWLRELMLDGLIALGDVDERSILDVAPSELAGYRQCHFFAGIGIWSLALRQAGWADDRPIWTGSCPCQPFSAAGKGAGFADERHLWPAFHWLINECRPPIVVGEQVSSDDGLAWIDLVLADLDKSGYACGALDTCAAGFGAPHIRQRAYWMADSGSTRREEQQRERSKPERLASRGSACRVAHADTERHPWRAEGTESAGRRVSTIGCEPGGMADTAGIGSSTGTRNASAYDGTLESERSRASGGMADTGSERRQQDAGSALADEAANGRAGRNEQRSAGDHVAASDGADSRPGPANGYWRNADWLGCRDGKWRPVASGTFPLAATGTVRNRVGTLRGAGNALNLAQAQAFIELIA